MVPPTLSPSPPFLSFFLSKDEEQQRALFSTTPERESVLTFHPAFGALRAKLTSGGGLVAPPAGVSNDFKNRLAGLLGGPTAATEQKPSAPPPPPAPTGGENEGKKGAAWC